MEKFFKRKTSEESSSSSSRPNEKVDDHPRLEINVDDLPANPWL